MLMLDLYSMSADPDPSDIIRVDEAMQLSGLRKTMFYDLIRKGQFPAQVELGARAVGWYKSQVLEWNRNRPSKRRGQGSRCVKTNAQATSDIPRENFSEAATKNSCRPKQPRTGTAAVSRIRNADPPRPEPSPTIKKASTVLATPTEPEELRVLRDENARLKRIIADLVLKNDQLKSAIQDNAVAS